MDVSTGRVDLRQLNIGDTLLIRSDIIINPNVNNISVQYRYKLGTGFGEYYLTRQVGVITTGAAVDYPFQFVDYLYIGDSNTRDNLIEIQVYSSHICSFINQGTVIQVLR